MAKQNITDYQQSNSADSIYMVLRSLIPFFIGIILMICGVWLLTLPLPGWKLILGLPSVQIGIVILIFVFDDLTKRSLHPTHYTTINCPLCGYENLIFDDASSGCCTNCGKNYRILSKTLVKVAATVPIKSGRKL